MIVLLNTHLIDDQYIVGVFYNMGDEPEEELEPEEEPKEVKPQPVNEQPQEEVVDAKVEQPKDQDFDL